MKKFIFTSLVLSTMTFIAFTGCKKDDSSSGGGTGTSKSTTDMLTGGSTRKWKQTSETHNGSPITQDPCDLDDRFIFTKSGNAFTIDFGTNHCDSGETNQSGSWALTNNDKTITISISVMGTSTPVLQADITSISDSQLIMTEIDQGDTTVTTLSVTN